MSNILYVDDQALLSKVLRQYLTEIGGHFVLYANTVDEAKRIILKKTEIDLFLLDIMMPLENDWTDESDLVGISTGLRLSKWIKSIITDALILAISVRHNISEDEIEEAGITQLITSPFDPNDLLKIIQILLTDRNHDTTRR